MSTQRYRARPVNPEAGLGWKVAALIGLIAGPIMIGLWATGGTHAIVLPLGILVTLGAIASVFVAIRVTREARGPYLLEIRDDRLHDLRSDESFHWSEIQSIRVVQSSSGEALEICDHRAQPTLVLIADLDQPVETIAGLAIDRHRNALGKNSLATELRDSGVSIPCPECGQESDSIKAYRYLSLMFILVAYGFQESTHVACPACTRKQVGKNLVTNLFTANVLWPFVCLPWGIVLLLMSATRGHSSSVLKMLAEKVAASGHESTN